jgi:drug/metabolite transporter (DMT)-like permease
MASSASEPAQGWHASHLAALIGANAVLALGPWFVRLADTGPVATGFWRLALAMPVVALLALRSGVPAPATIGQGIWLAAGAAGVFFGLDLASWHIGIGMTRLGNAALFGNSGSVVLMAIGLAAAGRAPRLLELAAIAAALGGTALVMGGSILLSREHFVGDLFCLVAGGFYALYILLIGPARAALGPNLALAVSMVASLPVLLGTSLALGETIMPEDWTPLVALALGSQVIGQGLLVYSLRHFSALVIGLALLTQPAISSVVGWVVYNEVLGPLDLLGMALLAAALVMVRAQER